MKRDGGGSRGGGGEEGGAAGGGQAWLSERGGVLYVRVKASPGASKTEIAGEADGRLRVRVAAAPEDGKANAALRAFFAERGGCPKSAVLLYEGARSRLKTFSLPPSARERLVTFCSTVLPRQRAR
jgi:uncharacterized protein YggU (UPF0235/DUF167 family)